MVTHRVPLDRIDLEALDSFLTSDRSPPDSMLLSDLDGFLTGIAIGPELILPSEWLPVIWGGEPPSFADTDEANVILGSILGRYNEILRQVEDEAFEPIFWTDRDGTLIAMDWAEGFLQAIGLRAGAWTKLLKSKRDGHLLLPIVGLCGDADGESVLGLPPEDDDLFFDEAPKLIPGCVLAIAAYWRGKRPPAAAPARQRNRAASKAGRNDPCPCGSGKKFKTCCGKNP